MSVIAKELAGLGSSTPDQLQVEIVISSLPAAWESALVSLNISDVVLTINTFIANLNIEAQRKKKKNITDSMMANVVNSSKLFFPTKTKFQEKMVQTQGGGIGIG